MTAFGLVWHLPPLNPITLLDLFHSFADDLDHRFDIAKEEDPVALDVKCGREQFGLFIAADLFARFYKRSGLPSLVLIGTRREFLLEQHMHVVDRAIDEGERRQHVRFDLALQLLGGHLTTEALADHVDEQAEDRMHEHVLENEQFVFLLHFQFEVPRVHLEGVAVD